MDSPGFERIARELALRRRLQEILLVFSRGVSARLGLETGLEALAAEVNTLFGTSQTSVWLHDRRGKILSVIGAAHLEADAVPTPGVENGRSRSSHAPHVDAVFTRSQTGKGVGL